MSRKIQPKCPACKKAHGVCDVARVKRSAYLGVGPREKRSVSEIEEEIARSLSGMVCRSCLQIAHTVRELVHEYERKHSRLTGGALV